MSGTQLDRGLYGPLIIEDPDEKADYDEELVVVLDDWIDGTGTNPDQVLANLRKTGMKPMEPGGPGVSPTTPLGADGGDVTYPYFVINGRVPADPEVRDYRAGQRIRLRVINAGSDTAFRVAVPGTVLNVIAHRRLPGDAGRRRSRSSSAWANASTPSFTVNASVPVVAVPEGKQGHAQLNLRVGDAPSAVKVDDFVAAVRTEVVLDTATLSPTPEVTLPARTPDQVIEAQLSGPGQRLHVADQRQALRPAEATASRVKPDQRVRIRMINESMMFHPIHLHGHTFEVVGRNGPARPQGHCAGATHADR